MKVIFLGLLFHLTFSVYFSAYYSVSQIYDQDGYSGLGQLGIIINYLSLGLFNMCVPRLLSKFNATKMMQVAAFGFALFPAMALVTVHCSDRCNQLWVYANVLVCSTLMGLFGALIWVSQSKIMTDLSTVETRGTNFGIFWALMQSSQITGNVLTWVLLGSLTHVQFLQILTLAQIGIACLYLLFPQIDNGDFQMELVTIKQTFQLLTQSTLRNHLSLFLLSGIIIGYFSGFLYKACEQSIAEQDVQIVNAKTAAVFIVLGIFECLAALTSGYLLDRVDRYYLATVSTVLVEISIIVSMVNYFEKNYTLCFVCAAFWGFSDCFTQNVITVLCSDKQFNGQVGVFSVYRLVKKLFISKLQALGVTFTMAMIIALQDQPGYIIPLGIGIIEILVNQNTQLIKMVE